MGEGRYAGPARLLPGAPHGPGTFRDSAPLPMRLAVSLALAALLVPLAAAQNVDPVAPGPNPVAPTPAAERLAGAEQRRALEDGSVVAAVPFRSVGPTVMSGRAVGVEGNPDDPLDFYVAYASGGLWRTRTGGTSFEPLFDAMPAITIGAIAVDWADPEGDGPTVWVGTGEANSSRSSYAGTGVYTSTDGGASWTHRGLAETHHVGRIVLGPGTAHVAAVGHLYSPNAERGVYRTADGGATWTHALALDDDTGAIDLARAADGRIYAATWTRSRRAWDFREGGPGSAIWASDDDGRSYTRLTVEGSGFPTGADVGRIGLAAHASGALFAVVDNQTRRPDEPDEDAPALTLDLLGAMSRDAFLEQSEDAINAFLDANNFPYSYTAETVLEDVREGRIEPVALVEFLADANRQLFDTPVVGAELYRSDDGGRTWARTHEGYLDDLFYSYGYYFSVVRVAPDDPDRLYILGVPLVASDDGGATWARADAPHVHVDHHDLWLNPSRPGHLISANDGGVNVSFDGGASWTKANTPPLGQFYTVQVDDAEPYNVYGGLQDNGVWVGPSTYSPSREWLAEGDYPYDRIMGGDGMQVQVDPRDDRTTYTGFQFGNMFRLDRTGAGRSTRITPRHELGERPLRFNWQTPIWLSRHVPDVLYLGSHRVHRSLDRGETWDALSDDLTDGGQPGDVPYGTLTTLHESPLEFGLVAAGTDDGHVWVSEDGGRTWQDRSAGLVPDLWVSRVELSGHDRGRLLVALNGYRWDHFEAYVYRSDDLGRTWTRVGTDLPAEPVNVAREDPANPDVVYVGTDGGLYVSLDGGASFQGFRGQAAETDEPGVAGGGSRTLPNVPVHDLVVQARESDLVVGTHGRSLWIADVQHVQALDADVVARDLHLFAPDTTTHRDGWGDRGSRWSEPSEPEVELAFFAGAPGEARIRVLDADGDRVREWTYAARRGLNFASYDLVSDRALSDDAEPGDATGAFYLVPGTYTVEVRLGGATERVPLVVEAGPPPRSRARKKMP